MSETYSVGTTVDPRRDIRLDNRGRRTRRRQFDTISLVRLSRGLVVLLLLAGCAGSTDRESSFPVETPQEDTAAEFDLNTWTAQNQDAFTAATSAMTRFADAVEVGEVANAQDAASEVRRGMRDLAASLDAETHQAARGLRAEFVNCGLAYGAAEEAIANTDADALNASAPLFRRCLGIATVNPP
jgi:hypothetical protein